MMELQAQVVAMKPTAFSPHLQTSPCLKPVVPPKPKVVLCQRPPAKLTAANNNNNKTTTATQVNLLGKTTCKLEPAKRTSTTAAAPIKPSGSITSTPRPPKFQANNATDSCKKEDSRICNDSTNSQKVTKKRLEKIYIQKTQVRKISETTVTVKPQVPPKPILKPPQVSFVNGNERKEGEKPRKGILKNPPKPITRSNSAIYARPAVVAQRGTLRPVQSFRSHEKDAKIPPSAIVFTGWRKSKTFPVQPSHHPTDIIPGYYYTTTTGCPLNCFTGFQQRVNNRRERNQPFRVTANSINQQPQNCRQPSIPTVPIPPPRTKRKSLSIIVPPNDNDGNFPADRPCPIALKTSPIYAKVNRSRKTLYKRNIRRYGRNYSHIYNNENITEKTSLLIGNSDSQKEFSNANDTRNCAESTRLQKVMNEIEDSCVVVGVKMKPRAPSPGKTSPRQDRKPQRAFTQEWGNIMTEARLISQDDPMTEGSKSPKSAPTELPDNSSFLFRLLQSSPSEDPANATPAVETKPDNDSLPNSNELQEVAETTDVHVVANPNEEAESQDPAIDTIEANSPDEIPKVIISPPEAVIPPVIDECPLISAISEILKTKNISIDSLDNVKDAEELTDPVPEVSDDQPTTLSSPAQDQEQRSDNEGVRSTNNRLRHRRKSSLIELVDNKIHKVQSLIAELSSGNEESSQRSSLNIENAVPRTVLLRKSSVPELCTAVLNEMLMTTEVNKSDAKLSRSSWANMSTSSVGSTSSSSSAPLSLKNRNNTYRRRLSDGVFWADEGDTSTGALGDIETSPYQSSNEAEVIQPSGVRPVFHRRRRICSDLLGKARKASFIVTATEILRHGSTYKKQHQQQPPSKTPKIQVLLPETSSSESKEAKINSMGEEDEEGSDPAAEERLKAETELYEKISQSLPPKSRKAFYVVREILTSEQTFLNVLHLITVDFPNSLRKTAERLKVSASAIISEPDLEYILGGLPILKGVNEDLFQDLYERAKDWNENSKIADIFVKKGAFLKHYTNYIKDFEKISRYFDQLYSKCPNFSRAVRQFEASKKCNHLGLKAYMLKPVQRMPQYSLLLEDYLKHLEKDHVDYEDTVKAIAVVRGVAEHANDAIRLQVSMEQLVALQKRVPHIRIIAEGVQLVKQGELSKVRRKELQPRYFSLITNSLLCFSYNGSSGKDLKLKYKLPLARMKVELPPSPDHEFEFTIMSSVRSFNVVAKSSKDRDEWMEALKQTIEQYMMRQPNLAHLIKEEETNGFVCGKQAPVWMLDAKTSKCQNCNAEFSLTCRRHHCRSCGKVFCRQCCSYEAPLEYLNFNVARVCTGCFDILMREFEAKNAGKEPHEKAEMRQKFRNLISNKREGGSEKRKQSSVVKGKFAIHEEEDEKLSGYLRWKDRKRWAWNWFSLVGGVLYVFDSSEEAQAVHAIKLKDYALEFSQSDSGNKNEGDEVTFKLVREGQQGILFRSENPLIGERWIKALTEYWTLPKPDV